MAIHKNDVGVDIIAHIVTSSGTNFDVSGMNKTQMTFERPDGTTFTKSGSDIIFTNSGVDGRIQYTTDSGTLDEVGVWEFQALVGDNDDQFHTTIGRFTVNRIL